MKRSTVVIFLSAFLVVACSGTQPNIPQQQQLDSEGFTPLTSAVLSNNKDSVQLLISKGADVNKESIWRVRGEQMRVTPLILAREKRNEEISKLLIDAGAK